MHVKRLTVFVLLACFIGVFPGASGSSAEERKKIELESALFGGILYHFCFAFSQVVNEHSTMVKLNPIATTGTLAGIQKVYEDPKGRITGGTPPGLYAARNARPPFTKPYPDMRGIGNFARVALAFITLNPDIKEVSDFEGLKVGLGPRPSTAGWPLREIIENGYGLKDKLKIFHMQWSGLKSALLDGTIDVITVGCSSRKGGKWVPVPVYQEIIASGKKVYFIGCSEEAIKKGGEAANVVLSAVTLKKDSVGPDQPQKDVTYFFCDLGLLVHKDLDFAIAYELTTILNDRWQEMGEHTGVAKGLYKELVSDLSLPNNLMHTGAMKYYTEKGLR